MSAKFYTHQVLNGFYRAHKYFYAHVKIATFLYYLKDYHIILQNHLNQTIINMKLSAFIFLLLISNSLSGQISFTVTNSNASGAGSLRWAVDEVAATSGSSFIIEIDPGISMIEVGGESAFFLHYQ